MHGTCTDGQSCSGGRNSSGMWANSLVLSGSRWCVTRALVLGVTKNNVEEVSSCCMQIGKTP